MEIGLVGVGAMGKNHARVLSELKEIDKLHICDVNETVGTELAKKYNGKYWKSVQEMLPHVETLDICTPTPSHYKILRSALESDTNVFVEKPFCANLNEANDIVSRGSKGIIGIGHIERFNPIVEEIKKIIKDPLYISVRRHNPASDRITDTSVVEDLMIHDIDVIFNVLHIYGRLENISCNGNNNVMQVNLLHDQVPILLSASRKSCKKIRQIYIETEEFTIEGDYMKQEITIYRKPQKESTVSERYTQENIIEKVLVNKVEPLKVELKTFIDCVIHKTPFPVTPIQAKNNIFLCECIKRDATLKHNSSWRYPPE